MHELDRMFRPRSVAVIGASADPDKLGGRTLLHLRELGYAGRIYPVNVTSREVQGLPAWPSVSELPDVPDSALVVLPARLVEAALEDCAAKGVLHVQVLSSGFAEEGAAGAAMQERLMDVVRRTGMRITGPNALGSISPPDGFFGTFSSLLATAQPGPGRVGVATQSGAFGSHIYAVAGFRGVGISRAIATGNEADLDVAACIEYLAADEGTSVICASLEGCRDGAGLRRALLRAAAARKPVIVMKVGRTAEGAAAAATHTGSLAGEDRIIDAVFRECGALRATTIEEMVDLAYLLSVAPMPPAPGVGILSVSGGIGVLMADAAVEAGLPVPAMPPATLERITSLQPMAGGHNPIDTTAQLNGRMHIFEGISQAMMEGTELGSFLFYLAHLGRNEERFPPLEQALAVLRHRYPDRLVVAVMTHVDSIRRRLEALGIPVFEDPSRAVGAVAGATRLRRLQEGTRALAPPTRTEALGLRNGHEADAKDLLARAGIPVPPERVCRTAAEARLAAEEIGFPVVLKILSADISHKTEVGGVLLGLADGGAVAAGFEEVMQRARVARPEARLDGVLIAPMLSGGVETIIGVQRDPVFGPMVMFGLGGVAVELFADVAFASAPLTADRAEALIASVRGAQLLNGFRGRPPCDRAALVRALCRVSELAASQEAALEGLEINPFLVRPDGGWALDALIRLRAVS